MLLRPVQFLVYLLVGLLPRDPEWWLFGSWSGHREADSPRAMFHYVNEHHSREVRPTWITADRSIERRMRAEGFDCRYRWSPSGIWAAVRAGVYVFDGLTRDINHWLSNGATLVNLRHGTGVKKVERAIDTPSHRLYRLFHGRWWERLFWGLAIPWHLPKPDMSIASSRLHAKFARESMQIPISDVHVTGLPRHDIMFEPDRLSYLTASERAARTALVDDPKPAFLFLPTFRDLGGSLDWAALNDAALGADVSIHVKLHIVDENRGMAGPEDLDPYPALHWVPPDADPVTLYPHATGLISDYSSASFDMMLLGKPVIYFLPDHDDFLAGRSLHLPLEEVSPGPDCRDHNELSTALRAHRLGELDGFAEEYDRVVDMFFDHRDGKNRERVFQMIVSGVS